MEPGQDAVVRGSAGQETNSFAPHPSTIPNVDSTSQSPETDPKSGKRRFWAFGKKKEDTSSKNEGASVSAINSPTSRSIPEAAPTTSSRSINQGPAAAAISSPYQQPQSPTQRGQSQSRSPNMPSPASSQIFERNVQEDGLAATMSPAIPSHFTTENHIPPVLDASSEALTDDHLNPDNVEIVMHSSHVPAATAVTGPATSDVLGNSWMEDSATASHPHTEAEESYGSLDSADVRRLSFISFADVVHAEQADHSTGRDPSVLSSPSSVAGFSRAGRSPSPGRGPAGGGAMAYAMSGSPLASSFSRLDQSPVRNASGMVGSPRIPNSPPLSDGLTIETMRQALRKTESGDLSGIRKGGSTAGLDDGDRFSQPGSPI